MRILYGGESHMDGVVAIIEGFPAGFEFDEERINRDLTRRRSGYGLSQRMTKEADRVTVYSGVIAGRTIGSPITLLIPNKDNRRSTWDPSNKSTVARPGHTDLLGVIKYRFDDTRLVAESASARQTTAWTAAGSLLTQFLEKFNIKIISFVESIGGLKVHCPIDPFSVRDLIEKSPLRIADHTMISQIKASIDKATEEGETLGGVITVIARGVPPGIGSYTHPDMRLDSQIGAGFMAIPGIKAVEIGSAFNLASMPGTQSCDIVKVGDRGFQRHTNHAGGVEGGLSNGQDIVIHAAVKPIPTLKIGSKTVDIFTHEEKEFSPGQVDACVVPAVSVIGEMVLAKILAEAFLDKFGADTFDEIFERYHIFREYLDELFEGS